MHPSLSLSTIFYDISFQPVYCLLERLIKLKNYRRYNHFCIGSLNNIFNPVIVEKMRIVNKVSTTQKHSNDTKTGSYKKRHLIDSSICLNIASMNASETNLTAFTLHAAE